MKIGVVSDTHKNIDYLQKASEFLISRQKVASIYHLGDDYEDVMGLEDWYVEIVQIPGIYDERYRNGTLPAKLREAILGLEILLVHSIQKDLTEDDKIKSDVILSGHTHKQDLTLDEGILYMNPGHLKGKLDKNMPPSFGMLSIENRSVTATIFDLNFKEINSIQLMRSESGLYRSY
ncbi:metallophosphoesterase family protein [Chitinispirillales bacterium ANBcel5]|uniref:metallophosphoesterase family protein n=1 Tax=Cellulosispirillum alkaliphilum TaxID=3039283 RepID=UPI002A55DD66|nr:metallophosphoesterase family protein [Chitinispirillales bacterium ANBcel5]